MSREIKFRAFDKKENDMVYGILPLSDGTFLIENANSEKFVDIYCDDNLAPNNYVIMQLTGLKDKNGKDIYEEDIYKYRSKIYKVYFSDSFAGVRIKEIVKPGNMSIHTSIQADTDVEAEVIGNIYENPELLS
jgi:uncharacterized phage protein (TIGR01671 family)